MESSSSVSKPHHTVVSKSVSASEGSVIDAVLHQLAEKFPQYKVHIDKIAPYAVKAGDMVDDAYPYMCRAYYKGEEVWEKLQPYNPQQFAPILLGLVICFFGGSYLTLIAAIECVRLVVWERMFSAFKILVVNYNRAYEASKKDDLVDEDGNGVADVLEITKKELLTRKIYLFFRTVDPNQVSDALAVLWAGMLSVVATLRVHFAQAVTLGCSLGEILDHHLRAKAEPLVVASLPEDLKRWGPVGTGYIFRFVGCVVAWWLKRLITGFHAAIRGADMIVTNAIKLGHDKGYVPASLCENSPQASVLTGLIAFMGFYWQLSNNFGLPFPLNILMLPVTISEWTLSTWVMFLGGGGDATAV